MISKIAFLANFNISDKAKKAFALTDFFREKNVSVRLPDVYREKIMRSGRLNAGMVFVPREELFRDVDLAVALGGDGFILEAARNASMLDIPVLGINLGRVGYMAELEPDEIEPLEKILAGDFSVDVRTMFDVTVLSSSGTVKAKDIALNDAVVAKGSTAHIVDLSLSDAGVPISDYRADGIVVATPTGSTAYSLSAGGAIVDPHLSCICVTPICPHSLLSRPLIFPDSSHIEIKNVCTREKLLYLTVDGKNRYNLYHGDTVVVTRSAVCTKLVRVKNKSFYEKIRSRKFM